MTNTLQKNTTKEKQHIYTVSQITEDIKLVLESAFADEIWIEGEISNFRSPQSGHFYFSLKDQNAILGAVMFQWANKDLKFKLEDGLKVICFGKINVYSKDGKYQLLVKRVEPKGVGAQQLAFEQLKAKLFKEGLFEVSHKKELPLMPFRIGIVTSSSGAAVRDILQILKKGAPCVDVLIRSVRVQGERAAAEIAQGIVELNEFKALDLIIVSRGGGSSEDLWSFNEEIVARAVYNSKIPIVSAVGHQINTTLSDLAADVFVETPSAAAKIIVDKKNALLAELEGYRYEMNSSLAEIIAQLKNALSALKGMLKSPRDRLQEKIQFLDELMVRLQNNMQHILALSQRQAQGLLERLDALSPLAVLSRGYSLSLRLPAEAVLKDTAELKTGDQVKTILKKGSFISTVKEVFDGKGEE